MAAMLKIACYAVLSVFSLLWTTTTGEAYEHSLSEKKKKFQLIFFLDIFIKI